MVNYFYGLDSTYFIFVLPALIISVWAQISVKRSFSKYSKIQSQMNITGAQAAQRVLKANGVYDVGISTVAGSLSDHYDPKNNVIRLSEDVYNSTSIAAIGVAAHEAGHAVQYAAGYTPIKIRSGIISISRIGSSLSWPIFMLGLVFNFVPLMNIGIILFTTILFFQIITLPVEFNASRRALNTLRNTGILCEGEEIRGASKVLTAAAMTYVAAMISSLAHLLRLIAISNRRK